MAIFVALLILLYLWYQSKSTQPQANPTPATESGTVAVGTNLSSRLDKAVNSFVSSFTPAPTNTAAPNTISGSVTKQKTNVPISTLPKIPPTGYYIRPGAPVSSTYQLASVPTTCKTCASIKPVIKTLPAPSTVVTKPATFDYSSYLNNLRMQGYPIP